jgi:SAM-dependent methyltransferase
MNEFDPATLDFYATEAPVYIASGPDGVARHLPAFLERLEPCARILELGCGGGRDAAHMLAMGFEVDATDGTAEIAIKAEERLGRPVRVMRFDALDSVAAYDAVIASASLLHVPRPALPNIIGRIWTALKPGGWHVASYKGGGTEGRDRFGRYFNYLDATELSTIYIEAGNWAEIDVLTGTGSGYDGVETPWNIITVRKTYM